MSTPNQSGSGDAPPLKWLTLPKIPANVVSFMAEVRNETSRFRVSGSRNGNVFQGTVREFGVGGRLSTSAFPLSSSPSGEITITIQNGAQTRPSNTPTNDNANEDESDVEDLDDDKMEEEQEEELDEGEENESDQEEEAAEVEDVEEIPVEKPFVMSFVIGGHTILVDDKLKVGELTSEAEEGIAFIVTGPESTIEDVTIGMGEGSILFTVTYGSSSGTLVVLSSGHLKIVPPKNKTKTVVGWQKLDDNRVRLTCK